MGVRYVLEYGAESGKKLSLPSERESVFSSYLHYHILAPFIGTITRCFFKEKTWLYPESEFAGRLPSNPRIVLVKSPI